MNNTIVLSGDMYTIGNNSDKIDYETLAVLLQMERVEMMSTSLQDQTNQIKANQDRYRQASELLAEARYAKAVASNIDPVTWSVDKDAKTIKLDGYEIVMEDTHQAWKIYKLDDNGNRISDEYSRVWGDPHVDEADGDKWDFSETVSFMLDDGTKITVGTKDLGHSIKVSDTLTITKGDQAIVVTGIADNNVEISDVTLDGRDLDYNTNDGYYAYEGDSVADWETGTGNGAGVDIGKITGITNRFLYAENSTTNESGEGTKDIAMSAEMLAFLTTNNIEFEDSDNDGKLNTVEWENVIDRLKGLQDSLNSTSQMEMIRLQQLMNKRSQSYEQMTNLISKGDKTKDSLISNLR